ncbi:MAG TPA: hypothetical protein VMD59_03650 [Acidimicrobiales bacterium]|nr:hypothetical protein [Acidimicrobiales bacterium]
MPNRSLLQRKWWPTSVPQTLQSAVLLLYLNAAISLIVGLAFGGLSPRFGLALVVGDVAGGYGIANEKKWGYTLAVAVGVIAVGLGLWGFPATVFSLIFAILLVVLLLHPMSRSYYKLWFR